MHLIDASALPILFKPVVLAGIASHPNSPPERYLTAQEIRLPTFPERVQSAANAYFQALCLAQFTGKPAIN